MTAFGKTLLGKAIGGATKLASIVTSPNPLMAASTALGSGVAAQKKDEVTKTGTDVKSGASRNIGAAQNAGQSGSEQGFFKKPVKIFGMEQPMWIWLIAGFGIVVLGWFLIPKLFKKKGSSPRRRSSSSSMRARMAKVRSYRRKRK